MKLFTVGYEGCEIEEFVGALQKHGIEHIADLRKNPISRKKGFSKKKMAEKLQEGGIEYTHLAGLGVPTIWRKEAKAQLITREKMFRDYVRKVIPAHQEEIEALKDLMKKNNLALLCYEADASDCHRRYVADELKAQAKTVKIVNLEVRPSGPQRLSNL